MIYNHYQAKCTLQITAILCSNNEYIDDPTSCPTTFPFSGSIFFAFNGSYNSTGGDVYTEAIEIGKLLVSEQVGEEQVQYTEREAPDHQQIIYITNKITKLLWQ